MSMKSTTPHDPLTEHVQTLFDKTCTDSELSSDQRQKLYTVLLEFSDLSSNRPHDLGLTDMAEHIIDTGEAQPAKLPPRRLPLAKQESAKKAIQDMYENGQIEPSSSPWTSPVVLAKKKDGSLCFCIDYRRLNEIAKKDLYPLPRIDDTLEVLAGSK